MVDAAAARSSLCSSAFWMRRSTSRIGVEILDELGAIGRPERALQRARPPRSPSRACCGPAGSGRAAPSDRCCRCRRTAVRTRRADCSRVGSGVFGPAPGDRVGVGAREPDVAGARRLAGFDRQLERCQLRVLADLRAQRSDPSRCRRRARSRSSAATRRSGTACWLSHGRRPGVRASARSSGRSARAADRGTARARSSVGVSSNAAPSAAGVQFCMIMPFGTYTTPKRFTGLAAVLRQRRQRRHHAVEQRQRQRRAEAAQHRAAGDGFLG